MKKALLMDFVVDKENSKVNVRREFAASNDLVWRAWTEAELLDQWWAPKPWRTETKTMDFQPGGYWLYAMIGPDGTTHWCREDYKSVLDQKNFSATDGFCDEHGKINPKFPLATWQVGFKGNGETTFVDVEIQYEKLEDLEVYIKMGFKEGFTAGLENLDELLSRMQLKSN